MEFITLDKLKKKKENKIDDSLINNILFNLVKEQQIPKKINYKVPLVNYSEKTKTAVRDFTNNIPLKKTEILPKSLAGSGFYGYTILGWNYMVRIRDLHPDKAYETDVHELVHTDDEYETRVIVRWMLSGDKEEKYKT